MFTFPVATPSPTPSDFAPKFELGIIPQPVRFQDPPFGLVLGIEVLNVIAGDPAQQNGIEIGDIITRVNDNRVRDLADLALQLNGSGGTVTLRIRDRRSGAYEDVGPITLLNVTTSGPGQNPGP